MTPGPESHTISINPHQNLVQDDGRSPCICHYPMSVAVGARLGRLLGLLLLLIAGVNAPARAQAPSLFEPAEGTNNLKFSVRIVWGGTQQRQFAGSISIEGGSLDVAQILNLQPDGANCVLRTSTSKLEVIPTSPSVFGGVDVQLQGTSESQLSLSFLDPVSSANVTHAVKLSELLARDWIESLDERGTHVAITRPMTDRIRIATNRESLIFSSQEDWRVILSGAHVGVPAGEYELHCRFVAASTTTDMIAQPDLVHNITVDATGSFPEVAWQWQVPAAEGVYLAEFSLSRKKLVPFLASSTAAVVRRLELVVLEKDKQQPRLTGWQPLFSVDVVAASQRRSLDWLAPWRGWNNPLNVRDVWAQTPSTLPAISHGTLGKRTVALTDDVNSTSDCLTIAPKGWLALPVTGLEPSQPHRLRVHVPTDQPLELATSVRSLDVKGELPALSRDAAIVVHQRECLTGGAPAIHEMLFWPSKDRTFILLVNASETHTATISQLEVEQGVVTEVETARESRTETSALPPARMAQSRMAGMYLDKPILIDSYSADRGRDPATGRELDNWDAFMQAIERMELVMQWNQSNTLMLKICADGGAIYPSRYLQPTLRYDSGAFFADGRNPSIKDTVELLFRRLNRTSNGLVLAIDVDAGLPNLVDRVALQPNVLQRDLQGNTPQQRSLPNARRYNPLNPAVQNQLLLVVRELVDRYSHHPSFRGIAIQLDGDSQFTFAGDRWGLDRETLEQFAAETRVVLPAEAELERWFKGPMRLTFLGWRAAKMTDFYSRMAQELTSRAPQSTLLLNALRLWEATPANQDFWNGDQVLRNPDEYLMAIGIDAAAIQSLPAVVLMQGSLGRNPKSVRSSDWILDMAGIRALRLQKTSTTGGLILEQPVGLQLEQIQELAPVSSNPSSGWLFPFAAKRGDYARQAWIAKLFESDQQFMFTGGWLPAGGQEGRLSEFQSAFASLPPTLMQDVSIDQANPDNLRVRRAVSNGHVYLQIINNSPWRERVLFDIQLTTPERTTVLDLASQLAVEPSQDASRRRDSRNQRANASYEIELSPFELVALRIDDPSAEIIGLQHQPVEAILPKLAGEINRLEEAVALSVDPARQIRAAEIGGDFEQWSTESRPRGWNVSTLPAVKVSRSTELPHSGRFALMIENNSPGTATAWVQSEPIPVPRTGRLTLQTWLRQPSTGSPATVRLSVIGRLKSGERFERSESFGEATENRRIANDWGHRPATLYVADLPEDLEELHVAIDVVGPGKVWVDDVEIFESLLHPDERIYLRGQLLVARQGLDGGNPFPAERLLDSHWGRYVHQFGQKASPARAIDERVAELPNSTASANPDSRSQWNQSKPFLQSWRDSFRDRWRR